MVIGEVATLYGVANMLLIQRASESFRSDYAR